MKTSFTREEIQKWIDATRAEVVVGPPLNFKPPQRSWTNEDVNRAWATSAHNVLSMLEKFVNQ